MSPEFFNVTMISYLKHFVKKYFQILWMRQKFSPAVQIAQRHLFNAYQTGSPDTANLNLSDTGFRVFSQFEEDGKMLFIFSKIGMRNESFVEIGADDGLNSNCANLALNFQWHGLFIDANTLGISRGAYFYKRYPNPYGYKPKFICSRVTRENINGLIEGGGYRGEIDLLSIDIDGNDYWIWDAITVVKPRVVIIETHINFGMKDVVVPYDANYFYPGVHPDYHGASPKAMVRLARQKGYRLIGANKLGFNFIFLNNEEGLDVFPEVSIEEVMNHPSCLSESVDPGIWEYDFVTPIAEEL
jgi:hypothetical protein